MNLADREVIFVDCQTTGSSPTTGGLLELAFARASARTELPEITYCIVKQPYNLIPDRIAELTGITVDDLDEAVSQRDVSRALRQALTATPYSVIHYAKFEMPFLRSLMFDPLVNYRDNAPINFSVYCTHEIARRIYPNFPARGIRAIAGFFGKRLPPLKRASSHVHATWIIWKYLVEVLAENNITTDEELVRFLTQPFKSKRGKYEYPISRDKRLGLPNKPGVYRMLDRHGDILYVGKATSLKSRVNSYFRGQKKRDPELLEMLTQVSDIDVTTCDTVIEAAVMESDLIKLHNPPYNAALKETGRQIFFCSRDFGSKSERPDATHTLGPFTSAWSLDRLLRLCRCASTGDFDARIFMESLDPHLLEAGVDVFCRRWSVTREQFADPRFTIAMGARLLRASQRGNVQLETEQFIERSYGQLHIESLRTQTSVIIKPERVAIEKEVDAEEVSWKIARLLSRVAQNYLRSRRLTRLLNCLIYVQAEDGDKLIVVNDGMLAPKPASQRELQTTERNNNSISCPHGDEAPYGHETEGWMRQAVWVGKTIADYDRISVLFQELQRVPHRVLVLEPTTDKTCHPASA